MLGGPWLHRLTYGAVYQAATNAFALLVLEAPLSGLAGILEHVLKATGRAATVTLSRGLGVLVGVPLFAIVLPHCGLTGPGIALLAGRSASLLRVYFSFKVALRFPAPFLVPSAGELSNLVRRS